MQLFIHKHLNKERNYASVYIFHFRNSSGIFFVVLCCVLWKLRKHKEKFKEKKKKHKNGEGKEIAQREWNNHFPCVWFGFENNFYWCSSVVRCVFWGKAIKCFFLLLIKTKSCVEWPELFIQRIPDASIDGASQPASQRKKNTQQSLIRDGGTITR